MIRTVTTTSSAMAKFCANLSFMFTDKPFLERYGSAKQAGFKAVESGFPAGLSKDEVVRAKESAGVEQVLVNLYTGDVGKGELGVTCVPGKQAEFKERFALTVEYAKALRARKIHIMSGKIKNPTAENDDCYEANLRYAVTVLEAEDIMGIIEPINNHTVPDYYMNCYEKALYFINKIGSGNLKVMADIFHMQHIRGNLTNGLRELKGHIGHVQIAQVPGRNEPDTPGEVNYKYVLGELQNVGYVDWIGLEYKPTTGLKWIKEFGYDL